MPHNGLNKWEKTHHGLNKAQVATESRLPIPFKWGGRQGELPAYLKNVGALYGTSELIGENQVQFD